MTISGGGALEITASVLGAGVNVDGNLTITGTTVTINRNVLFVMGDFTVSDASRVSVTTDTNAAVYCNRELAVTGGSSLTSTNNTSDPARPSVQANGGITVSDAGSKLRGESTAGGIAIVSSGAINGPVTEPVGGVVGEFVHPIWGLCNTVLNTPSGTRASAATLLISAAPGGDAGGGGIGADVPKTGDNAPLALLCGLVLLSGAGLAVSVTRRRRKQNGN